VPLVSPEPVSQHTNAADVEDRARLRDWLRSFSVRYGNFMIASGQSSSVYVDAKLTTCKAVAIPVIGRVFLRKMQELGWRPKAVGGLTMGADPIAAAIAGQSIEFGLPMDYFLVRKEPKKHGSQRHLEGLAETQGIDVVVLDDVCTTGESTIKAIRCCRDSGLRVLGAICLVDREQGAAEAIAKLECPFSWIFKLPELLEETP